jgi:hypothetical protein
MKPRQSAVIDFVPPIVLHQMSDTRGMVLARRRDDPQRDERLTALPSSFIS